MTEVYNLNSSTTRSINKDTLIILEDTNAVIQVYRNGVTMGNSSPGSPGLQNKRQLLHSIKITNS